MKRFADIIFSFAPHIVIPEVYIFLAGGKNGFIKKIDRLKWDTKGKKLFYGLATGVLSVLLWLAVIYMVMNVALIVLNLIPGIAI